MAENKQENKKKVDLKVTQGMESKKAEKGTPDSNPEMKEKNISELMHYDPSAFGYNKGEKVPFEGNLILWALGFAHAVALSETTVVYETKESFDETRASAKETVTDLGLQGIRLYELLTQGHLENIDKGVAVHQDVLTGKTTSKAFDITKVEKEG